MDKLKPAAYTVAMALVTYKDLVRLPQLHRFHRIARRLCSVNIAFMSSPGLATGRSIGARSMFNPFCLRLQEQPDVLKRCAKCDLAHARKAARQGKPLRYHCHLGLTEFIVPVLSEGEEIALVQCGQVLDAKPDARKWRRVRQRILRAGLDPGPLKDLYMNSPVVPLSAQKDLMMLLSIFADQLVQAESRRQLLEGKRLSRITERTQEFIRGHLTEPISLDVVASFASTSKRNLCRVFKAETGRTTLRYIHEQRIGRACDLLQYSQEKLTRIAYLSGFGTIQQFNAVFRQLRNCTPTDWRARHGITRPAPPRVEPAKARFSKNPSRVSQSLA